VGDVTPSPNRRKFSFFLSKIQKFSCVLLEKVMVHPSETNSLFLPPMLVGSGYPCLRFILFFIGYFVSGKDAKIRSRILVSIVIINRIKFFILDMTAKSALTVYKNILHELSINNSLFSYRLSPIYLKIKDEYHRYRPITSKYCKHTDEVLFVARTYLTYLESVRQCQIIHSTYSKGEKTIQQAANIVGLNLPKTTNQPHLPLNQKSD